MGCDIHLRLQTLSDDDTWVDRDIGKPVWDYAKESFEEFQARDPRPEPGGRHYIVFAFLANVRNAYTFLEATPDEEDEEIGPCFPERGKPDDMPPYVDPDAEDEDQEEERDGYDGLGDHSFTWATVAELRAAPWDVFVIDGGYLSQEEYANWKASGEDSPSGWCGGAWGPNLVKVTEAQWKVLSAEGSLEAGKQYLIRCVWKSQPLLESGFKRWLDETLTPEYLGVPDDRARVVMGFDS